MRCGGRASHLGLHQAFDGLVNVGIIKYKKRRVSAKLERDFLHGAGGLAHQQLPHARGARKGQLADERRLGQHLGGVWARLREGALDGTFS